MISVVIPTLNAERALVPTLSALGPAAVRGLVREVIIADGGSADATSEVAEAAGAEFLRADRGRGAQMAAGARTARSEWLLFLHADTVLEQGWECEVEKFIERVSLGQRRDSAAAFRFALDDFGYKPRILESLVALRCMLFRLPYGDQGLLISRRLYQSLGGFRPLPLMEDVDIAHRLGRRRLTVLRSCALTSAVKYRDQGYFRRAMRNLSCLTLYYMRVPPRLLVRYYESGSGSVSRAR